MTDVSLPIAVLHQAVGALVVAATVWGVHIIGRNKESLS
jgi:cytochrome c oxidase assembly protein subunit 15